MTRSSTSARLRRLSSVIATAAIAIGLVQAGAAVAQADDPSQTFSICFERIAGTVAAGDVVWADNSGIQPSPTAIGYQWNLDGQPIPGATNSTLLLDSTQVGHALSLTVEGTAPGYESCEATSPAYRVLDKLTVGTVGLTQNVRAGQTISVDAGTWTDGTTFSYEWSDGTKEIPDADGPTWTPDSTYAGKTIYVTVTGSKDGYVTQAATTATTVVDYDYIRTSPPVVRRAGTATTSANVGDQLSADIGAWYPAPIPSSLTYQWNRNGAPIEGATGSTYTTTADDAGDSITVTVSGFRPGWPEATATSAAVGPVHAGFAVTHAPVVSNVPVIGVPITATVQSWSPAATLRWDWYSRGALVNDQVGGGSSTYTPKAGDLGSPLTVTVSATSPSGQYQSESTATQPVLPSQLVVGAASLGTVKLNAKVIPKLPTIPSGATVAYQWLINGQPIAGATATTYTPEGSDWNKKLQLRVSISGNGYTAGSSVSNAEVVHDGTIRLGGASIAPGEKATIGATLHAVGYWSPSTVTVHFEWFLDGDPWHPVHTGPTFTVTSADYPGHIHLFSWASGAHLGDTRSQGLIGNNYLVERGVFTTHPYPTITGAATVGSVLTANRGTWSPSSGTTYAYQWYKQTSASASPVTIPHATSSTYKPSAALLGDLLTVRVTASKKWYQPTTERSDATGPIAALPASPGGATDAIGTADVHARSSHAVLSLAGVGPVVPLVDPTDWSTVPTAIASQPVVGQPTAVDVGDWSPRPDAISYQWMLDGSPIVGATSDTYTPDASALGRQLSVAVTASRAGASDSTVTAADQVVLGSLAHTTATLTGAFQAGSTMSVTGLSWTPSDTTVYYRWYDAGREIPALDEHSSITVTDGEASDRSLSVQVLATRSGYLSQDFTLTASRVTQGPFVPGQITLAGVAQQDHTLSAFAYDFIPTPNSITYQWARDGVAIAGATGTRYVLTAADAGHTISVTATAHLAGFADSSVTATMGSPVVASATALPIPTISGTAEIGVPLKAKTAEVHGQRVAGWNWYVGGVLDDSQHEATYWPDDPQDVGKTITAAALWSAPDAVSSYAEAQSPLSRASLPVRNGSLHAPKLALDSFQEVGIRSNYSLLGVADRWPLTYKWTVDGKTVGTDDMYTPTGDTVNKLLRLQVTVTVPGLGSAAAISHEVRVSQGFNRDMPEITPSPKVGETLHIGYSTVDPWLPDYVSVAWYTDKSSGADRVKLHTGSSYTVPASMDGKRIFARVTMHSKGLEQHERTTHAVVVKPGSFTATPEATVTGTGTVGSTLVVAHGTWAPASGTTFTYQWFTQANAGAGLVAIAGATGSTLVVPASAAAETVFARVTAHHAATTTTSEFASGIAIAATPAPGSHGAVLER